MGHPSVSIPVFRPTRAGERFIALAGKAIGVTG